MRVTVPLAGFVHVPLAVKVWRSPPPALGAFCVQVITLPSVEHHLPLVKVLIFGSTSADAGTVVMLHVGEVTVPTVTVAVVLVLFVAEEVC